MDFCQLSSFFSYSSQSKEDNFSISSVTIRMAQMRDLRELVEVLTQSFHPHQGVFSLFQPLLKLGVYEDLRSRLRAGSPYYCCLVAIEIKQTPTGDKESVIGTVELSLRTGVNLRSPYISNLAVSQTHRRQGVARHLLLKCEQIAREWNYYSLSLHVLDNNNSAKQLYISSGYQLYDTELNWQSWLFPSPRRLFLQKMLKAY